MLEDLWSRIAATQPVPQWETTAVLIAVAAALTWTPFGYHVTRHLLTLTHEAGHAAVALVCGRQLSGIRLHSDTSGVTLSRGRPRGPGMIATVLAGYPAPAAVGLAGAFAVGAGYPAAFLWALVGLCALMLLLIRNLYGLWVVLAVGVSVAALSWAAPPQVVAALASLVVWCLLLAAPRAVVDLGRSRRRSAGQGSDADQLARLTHLPAALWVALFWLVCLAALALGLYLLTPIAGWVSAMLAAWAG